MSPDALLVRVISTNGWTLTFWRGLLISLAFSLFLLLRDGHRAPRLFVSMGWAGVAVAVFYALDNLLFVAAIQRTSAANALVLLGTSPFFAVVFARFFLHEAVPRRTLIAIAIAFIGIVILFSGELGRGQWVGNLCAISCAAVLAGKFVVLRRARKDSVIPALAAGALLGSLLTAPLASPFTASWTDLGFLAVMGLVVHPIAFGLITVGPRHLSAPEVSLVLLLETVLGPLWVFLVTGEAPGAMTWMGGGLVLVTLLTYLLLELYRPESPGAGRGEETPPQRAVEAAPGANGAALLTPLDATVPTTKSQGRHQ